MDVKALKFEPALKYKHLEHSPVAFFCAEYALDNEFTTYAGGLGVLAGDFVLEAVDEGLPLVALGLKYGSQSNVDDNVGHFSLLKQEGTPVVIEVPYGESSFKAQVWVRCLGQSVYLFLLDSRVDDNLSNDQVINAHLYDTDSVIRIKQEMLLGIGGVKLLTQIGLTPSVYHLNEGHTAFAGFELLVNHHRTEVLSETLTLIKKKIVATKHTIFPLAGSNMGEDELTRIVGPYCDKNKLSVGDVFQLGKYRNNGSLSHVFSTTQFMLNCAVRQNGVSVLHTVFEKKTHPQSLLFPITNGVYAKRWQAPDWHLDLPEGIQLTDSAFWNIKQKLRERMINYVFTQTGIQLDRDVCTIVWSRRFAPYKQPELLFSDLTRLKEVFAGQYKIQVIISGQAHHSDTTGLEIVERIRQIAQDPAFDAKIVYLPGYSIHVATELVLGADVWLNTPKRGFEACGTSGMKAGLNGALQVSTSDGWIDEVDWTDTGFILPDEETARALYNLLETKILPLFYTVDAHGLPLSWIQHVRRTQQIVENGFTARRMLYDYLTQSYLVL